MVRLVLLSVIDMVIAVFAHDLFSQKRASIIVDSVSTNVRLLRRSSQVCRSQYLTLIQLGCPVTSVVPRWQNVLRQFLCAMSLSRESFPMHRCIVDGQTLGCLTENIHANVQRSRTCCRCADVPDKHTLR